MSMGKASCPGFHFTWKHGKFFNVFLLHILPKISLNQANYHQRNKIYYKEHYGKLSQSKLVKES